MRSRDRAQASRLVVGERLDHLVPGVSSRTSSARPTGWSRRLFHGFQLWVNLPRDQKLATPRHKDIRASEFALALSPHGGALARVW